MFRKLLIANRGEIAVRIMRTCQRLDIGTVAVYSDADRRALHVLEADRALYIGAAPASESYLNITAIVQAALGSGAEAVHPGYGLLSENGDFAEACAAAGLAFVGPSPDAIRAMGDKSAARKLVAARGVPVIPGYNGDRQEGSELMSHALEIGFPVMVKAAAGGGGRGMRLVETPDRLEEAVHSARREAQRAFGDGRLILERAVVGGRHVEVQVLADHQGNIVHLGERDCSVQRRHQKVIEESPSPAVDADLGRRMGQAAVEAALAVGYTNAGTVEFLLTAEGEFFFLEMNTRLQVEHGVTELVTGLDIVALQIAIAAGEPLPFRQDRVTFSGHALECRIYAEDPLKGYLPSPGRITVLRPPSGEGVRNDLGVYEGDEITTYYDPLLAKVLTWGRDRHEALQRMERALADYRVEGVGTNLSLLAAVLAHPVFQSVGATTDFLDTQISPEALVLTVGEQPLLASFGALMLQGSAEADPWRAAGPWRAGGVATFVLRQGGVEHVMEGRRVPGTADEWTVGIGGRERPVRFALAGSDGIIVESEGQSVAARVRREGPEVQVTLHDRTYRFELSSGARHGGTGAAHRQHGLTAPMPGLVLKVLVRQGERVRAHQTLIVIEAMKMEHAIEAPHDGIVKKLHCAEGGRVAEGASLVELEQETAG